MTFSLLPKSNVFLFPFSKDNNPYEFYFEPGYYTVEGWGASGGSYVNTDKGLGAYANGTIIVQSRTHVFIYVGGEGMTSTGPCTEQVEGGFNGGGRGGLGVNNHWCGSGGGGSTDIRLNESVESRIFVVAGGGGESGMESARVFANYGGNGGQGNGGGGSGYYGGYSSQITGENTNAGGNGGSSYVSSDIFFDINIKSGDEDFNSPEKELEKGHKGNGYLKIIEIMKFEHNFTCKGKKKCSLLFELFELIAIFILK